MNYWMRFSHDLKNNTDRGGWAVIGLGGLDHTKA